MSQQEIQLLEEFIDEQQVRIKDAEALERLLRNRDFKRIVDNGLFNKEATRLVMLKADPDNQDDYRQTEILKGIDSIGYLRNHFNAITALGGQAKLRTDESRQAIAEIRSEMSHEETDSEYTNE